MDDTKTKVNKWRLGGRVFLMLILSVTLILSGRWLYWRLNHVTTNAAYIKADMANIAPEVPGRISEITVKEGQAVQAGQVLLRIDPEQLDRHLGLADADLASGHSRQERSQAELNQARLTVPATIDAARAALAVAGKQKIKAQANLDHWQLQYKRFKQLQTIGKARFDEVETSWRVATADFNTAEAQVSYAAARLKEAEASRSVIAKAEAVNREVTDGIHKAEEARKLAKLNRSRCEVKAPINGVVARILVREGDYATPGRPALGIYNPDSRYIEARFEETKVRHITPGKKAVFTVDNFPDRNLTGTVVVVTPASAAEFALIPRDVSAGEFTKVVQRIPVRIAIDNLNSHPDLLPGLSCEVSIAK
jgi:membrane fusion protein (multidrug efflux system)